MSHWESSVHNVQVSAHFPSDKWRWLCATFFSNSKLGLIDSLPCVPLGLVFSFLDRSPSTKSHSDCHHTILPRTFAAFFSRFVHQLICWISMVLAFFFPACPGLCWPEVGFPYVPALCLSEVGFPRCSSFLSLTWTMVLQTMSAFPLLMQGLILPALFSFYFIFSQCGIPQYNHISFFILKGTLVMLLYCFLYCVPAAFQQQG